MMSQVELYKLQSENTELEAKLTNLRLKRETRELAAFETSGSTGPAQGSTNDAVAALEEKLAEEKKQLTTEAKQFFGTIESEEAQGFRLLTDGLTGRQVENLTRVAQFMRETGLDTAVIYA